MIRAFEEGYFGFCSYQSGKNILFFCAMRKILILWQCARNPSTSPHHTANYTRDSNTRYISNGRPVHSGVWLPRRAIPSI